MELLDREELIKRGITLIVVTEETISTIGCPEERGVGGDTHHWGDSEKGVKLGGCGARAPVSVNLPGSAEE
ncbi:hypothetical protein ES703_29206 [subsurface metagenome]